MALVSITLRSLVRVQCPPLVLTVAKFADRWVIRQAGIFGCRPVRVLSPVLATSWSNWNSGNPSHGLALGPLRDCSSPSLRRLSGPISPKTLGCLCVSRDPGYRVLRALNRSISTGLRPVASPIHGVFNDVRFKPLMSFRPTFGPSSLTSQTATGDMEPARSKTPSRRSACDADA